MARIIDDHRGHIDVESEPGRGTTCTVRFTVAASSAQRRSTPSGNKTNKSHAV